MATLEPDAQAPGPHAPESAGRHLMPPPLVGGPDEPVGAVPVVDAERHLLGVVLARVFMSILHREHIENLRHLSGIARHSNEALSATVATSIGLVLP